LTEGGFGLREAPEKSYLELALITSDPEVHQQTIEVIQNKLIGNRMTMQFATWIAKNREKIATAKGGN
jgi:hypothetical protein